HQRSTPFPYTTLFRSRSSSPRRRTTGSAPFPGGLDAARGGPEIDAAFSRVPIDLCQLLVREVDALERSHVRLELLDAACAGERRDRKSTRLNSSHDQI